MSKGEDLMLVPGRELSVSVDNGVKVNGRTNLLGLVVVQQLLVQVS